MSQQQTLHQYFLAEDIPVAYEKYMVPAIFRPAAVRLVEMAQLQLGESVLDVACGTGIVARLAAQQVAHGGRVVGLDLNPNMLAVARSVTSGTQPEIDWRAGNATELPFGDDSFDVVLCQYGLQYFPDRLGALREMHRALKPRGRLLLNVPLPLQTYPSHLALANALERYAGPEVAAIINAPFALGRAEELRSLVVGAGFQQIRIRIEIDTMRFPSAEEFVRRQVMGSPLAGPVSQISDDAQTNVIAHVATALRSYIDDDGLATPMATHFVVAFK